MKIKVNRQELLRSWQIAMKYVASQTPNVELTGIRMIAKADDTLTLEATDMKRAVKRAVICLVDAPGEALLNAAMLGDMLKKSSAEWLTLETTEKRGTLTTEFSRMRFTIIPSASYPQLPSSQDAEEICEIDEADFVRLVVEGGNASSRPSEFPKYMGTCLLRSGDGKLIVVSTDGRRLSLSQSQCDVKMDMDLVVPASSLKDLVKDLTCKGTLQVKVDGAMMWFIVKGAEYSIRLIDTTFPKYEKILKDEYVSKLRVNRNALIGALERIAVIANNTENRIMAMQLGSDLKLRARAAGLGTAQETISGVQLEGANLLIGFNVNFLLEGLKAISTEDVLMEFSGDGEQVRIYNSDVRDFLYMLMPVKLSSQDISDDVGDDEAVNAENNDINNEDVVGE